MDLTFKHKKVKCFHPKLSLFRSSDPLTCTLIWGVNYSLSQLKHVLPRVVLLADDFKSYLKIKVMNYFFDRESVPNNFKFKEYCPLVFQKLRERFDIDDSKYLKSFINEPPQWDLMDHNSKILKTYNHTIVVKVLSSLEVAEMHRILIEYYEHIVSTGAQTLLPCYLFMYRITINDHDTYFLGILNVFNPNKLISVKYELKGCTIDREGESKDKLKLHATFKDVDFLKSGYKILVDKDKRDDLLRRLETDMEFLQSKHLIDYRLLIGIHKVDEENQLQFDQAEFSQEKSHTCVENYTNLPLSTEKSCTDGSYDTNHATYAIESSDEKQPHVYFFGIIDILTRYGMKQKTVQTFQTTKFGQDPVKPDVYAKRLLDFIAYCIVEHP